MSRPPCRARSRHARSPRDGWFETLEARRLLHGPDPGAAGGTAGSLGAADFHVHVNFQPPRVPVPDGYLPDTGNTFADRGNGHAYGWDAANTAYRDRDSALSSDQRYDTFTHTQRYGTRTWELAVPDGAYVVRVVAGDPSTYDSVYGFDVEGVGVVSGKPTSTTRWLEASRSVIVSDGRLTVSNSAAAVNNKLAFIEVSPAAQQVPTVSVTAPDPAAAESGPDPARFQFNRSGPTASALTVRYTVSGTAAAGTDYTSLSGTIVIAAGALSATLPITPRSDGRVEGNETIMVSVVATTSYAVGSPAGATVSIDDADDVVVPAQWATAAPSPVARFESASASIGGKLYVFGGYDKNILAMSRSDVYDPATDRWSPLSPMPRAVTHAGVAQDGAVVYFAGGFVGERSFVTTSDVWKYDARTNTWSAFTPLPERRAAGGLVRLGRELHYFGGASALHTRDYGDHWVLNLDAAPGTLGSRWTSAAPLPNPRNHFGYAALNGRMYAIGGQRLNNERTGNFADVHAFDPATGRWSAAASLPLPRSHNHTSTVVLNGRIYLFGGQTNNPYFPQTISDVTSYDPATNTWSALPPLPDVRQAAAAQAIGQRIYVTTGTSTGIRPQTTTWWKDFGAAVPRNL